MTLASTLLINGIKSDGLNPEAAKTLGDFLAANPALAPDGRRLFAPARRLSWMDLPTGTSIRTAPNGKRFRVTIEPLD
ncbi:hypothetical protein [Singulisphaera acidiphila]|uniref:Uncharacterized protein n=1 Tax=Singulisphaera acidiphila (strain ATCC BAA-1392 / DSM 18658 / VKM B-2454 / MOB10) TaxID=886293 RepID=L0DTG6_SINAD|nr:hypothetical protein [Singulisphaera acidiphila]AGA31666.1 hypothetical protein Sinac_7636 [Singulisphaera acidiphila DSM 18658]